MTTNTMPGLKKSGRFWHYSLMVNGQRAHGSTRASDLATAKNVLEAIRKDLLNGQLGIVTKIPTLAELTKEWTKVHQKVHSKKHLTSVEQHTRIWILPQLGTTRIDRIHNTDLLALRSIMLESGRSVTTANNAHKILKLLLGYAIRVGYIDRMPFRIRMLKAQRKPRPTISATLIQDVFSALDTSTINPQIPILIRVMVGLGLRESEALGMRWEWFDPDNRTYTVGKSKNKGARVLPVPSWLWDAIHTMPKTINEWVFPGKEGNRHYPQFCKKSLKRVCEKLCLGNVTQHRLRATFASLHAEASTPITEIQSMLGHKSVTTTMLYVETSLNAKRKAQDALGMKLGLA